MKEPFRTRSFILIAPVPACQGIRGKNGYHFKASRSKNCVMLCKRIIFAHVLEGILMKLWIRRWGPAIMMMALIFTASSIPGSELPQLRFWDTLAKKTGHMVGYALMAAFYLHAVNKGRRLNTVQILAAFCLTILYALSDEWHQGFTPGRTPSYWDVLIDAGGGLIGLALLRVLRTRVRDA